MMLTFHIKTISRADVMLIFHEGFIFEVKYFAWKMQNSWQVRVIYETKEILMQYNTWHYHLCLTDELCQKWSHFEMFLKNIQR